MLKPFYQPFRHRYEEPLNKIYYSIDPILELLKSLQALSQINAQKLLQIEDELSNIKSEMHRHIDFTYRDIMIAMEIQKPFLSICDVVLATDYPIAYKSLDHLYPHGTVRDNTRYPRFIEKCEEIFEKKTNLSFLDLGCSGGGLVLDAALKGHLSVGLEGSNCSQKEQRAEWRLLGGRLKTCDISKPFSLYKADGTIQSFDIISAWEVLEHIEEKDLPGLFDNINRHLSDDGIFVASIANYNDFDPNTGINWHVTVHPYVWWETKFREAGYFVCTDLFDVIDLPRGGYNPPHCYENPYSEIDRSKTFHIAVKRIKQKENE